MKHPQFKFSHLLIGTAVLLIVEAILVRLISSAVAIETILIICALIGAGMTLYVAIEAIEEVRNRSRVILFLFLIVLEFIIFFAFQYGFLLSVAAGSFPTLSPDPLSLILSSTMVFIFNPLYLPADTVGRILLLIQTLSSLGLVLFILQNIWQFREKETGE